MTVETSQLPPGWISAALGQLAGSGQYGWTTKAAEQGTIKFLRTTDITRGFIDWEKVPYCSDVPPISEKYLLHDGDILISRAGSVGFSALLNNIPCPAVFASYLIRFLPDPRIVNPRYLAYFLQSADYWQQITFASAGIALSNVNATGLTQISVPVAPRPEQDRIAAKIKRVLTSHARIKATLGRVPAMLDRLRQSILAAAFRGDLTADWRIRYNCDSTPHFLERIQTSRTQPSARRASRVESANLAEEGASVGDLLPSSWRLVRLGEICRLQPGFAFKSEWYQTSGVRLLRGVNIAPGSTRWEDAVFLSEARATEFGPYVLTEGDVVIAMDRPLIAEGLKVCQITAEDLPCLLLQRVGRLFVEPGVLRDYIYLFLHGGRFIKHIAKQSTGTQLPHISANDIESAYIPVPPTEEQAAIVKRVRSLLNRHETVAGARDAMESALSVLESAVLAKAFRGEFVPQDPTDEPASALLERLRAEATGAPAKLARRPRTVAGQVGGVAPRSATAASQRTRGPAAEPATHAEPRTLVPAVAPATLTSPTQQSFDLGAPVDFLELPADAQAECVHRVLLGEGPLEREVAVRRAAELLRDAGLAAFQRLRGDGTLATCIDAALSSGLRQGRLDRPQRGSVRAVAREPNAVPPALWQRAVLAALAAPRTIDDAVRAAAAWSQEQFGLEFQRLRSGGHIDTALRSALAELVTAGEVAEERGRLSVRGRRS